MKVINVAAAVIWRGDLILAAQRPLDKPRGGFWEFPGGKQEPGETMEETLVREVKEELGLDCLKVLPWRVVRHQYPDMIVELHFMHVLEFCGELMAHDGQCLRWVNKKEARQLPFLPADAEILEQLPDTKPVA